MSVIGFGSVPEAAAPTTKPARIAPLAGALDSGRIVRSVFAIAAVLLLLGYAREIYLAHYGFGTVLKNLRHFDLDSEATLPAWFSSGVLLACAVLLAAIAALSRQAARADWVRWALLAAIFAALAADEATQIHEVAITPLRNAFKLSGALHFSWVIPGAALVAGLGVYFLPFLLRLPRNFMLRFAVAGALFVGGALGMELVSGYHASTHGVQSAEYIVSAMTEETMELAGSTVFLASLFAYVREAFGGFSLAFR